MSRDFLGIPFARGSATSKAAAEAILDSAAKWRQAVARCIRECGRLGATCDEVERSLNARHQTASARIRELFVHGLIRDSGDRRKTRSGRQAIVWITAREDA